MANVEERPSPLLVAELLEQIISYLPATDMARCQRTSKFWRNVINGSSAIKIPRFLLPVKEFETLLWLDHHGLGHQPFISTKLRPLSEIRSIAETEPILSIHERYPIVSLHPILLSIGSEVERSFKTSVDFCTIGFEIDSRKLRAIVPGTWLDMLISQPPVYQVDSGPGRVCWFTPNAEGEGRGAGWMGRRGRLTEEGFAPQGISKTTGITFRDLLESISRRNATRRSDRNHMTYEDFWNKQKDSEVACVKSKKRRPTALDTAWDFVVLIISGSVGEHTSCAEEARRKEKYKESE